MKRWTNRQIERGKLSNTAFLAGLPAQEREFCDSDYAETLPEKDRIWLRTFEQEYYGGRWERDGGVQLNKGEQKKECTRRLRSHRYDRTPDLMTRGTKHGTRDFEPDFSSLLGTYDPEEEIIEGLDTGAFKAWKVKNSNSLQNAKRLFQNLTKARNRLRLIKLARALTAAEKLHPRLLAMPDEQGAKQGQAGANEQGKEESQHGLGSFINLKNPDAIVVLFESAIELAC